MSSALVAYAHCIAYIGTAGNNFYCVPDARHIAITFFVSKTMHICKSVSAAVKNHTHTRTHGKSELCAAVTIRGRIWDGWENVTEKIG